MAGRWGRMVRRLLILPPLGAGVVILMAAAAGEAPPTRSPAEERVRAVRVLPVPEVPVVPRATGYGTVTPGRTWEAVAEVKGRVITVNPDLENGAFVAKGAELFRIDPTDYELALARTEADLLALRARLAELEQRERNTRSLLALEREDLELAQKELRRQQSLARSGTAATAAVEAAERSVMGQRRAIQNQRNVLALLPAERERLEAEIAAKEAVLAQDRENLIRTTLRAPFSLRVAEKSVEMNRYVSVGQTLVVGDGLTQAEINTQVPLHAMRALLLPAQDMRPALGEGGNGLSAFLEATGLTAEVRLSSGDFTVIWPGTVARIANAVDPKTRTVGVIVVVDDPYAQAVPGRRPPLTKNMFVEVELRGHAMPPTLVIPRTALRADGTVLVANDENRLERRAVTVGLRQDGFLTVDAGLSPGDRVVLSDLAPAIDGMRLDPTEDRERLRTLVATATGKAP